MNQERFLGVNIEYPQTNKLALASIIVAAKAYHLFNGFEVVGELPKTGPAIVVTNHTSSFDILKMAYVCFTTSERVIRGVARKGLLDPNYREPEAVLARTRKKGDSNPARLPLLNQTLAFIFNGIGAIPVIRGGERNSAEDRQFLLACDEVLNSNQLLGIFIQETRVKAGDLENPMPGVNLIARKHPDVPIVPVGIWARHFGEKVVIGPPFTYNELAKTSDHRLGAKETTTLIVDRIAANLHSDVQTKWKVVDRPRFLAN